MFGQSAAASTVSSMNLYFNSPMYTSMPAPYIWYEPSFTAGWTAQPGSLKNFGSLYDATFGTNPSYLVQVTDANAPSGSAVYAVDDSTSVYTSRSSLAITPAADVGATSLVVMLKATTASPTKDNTTIVGVGGIAIVCKDNGGSPVMTPGIYQPGALLTANNLTTRAGFPNTTTWSCYVMTFTPDPNTYTKMYLNGTLTTQGEMGYSYASYATAPNINIIGRNNFNVGSILRFNYALDQTQITAINNFMKTLWGPLA